MTQNSSRFLRQQDICPPEKLAFPITVIGAGAIGSATVLTLAKMGCSRITVWDDDILEEVNIPSQMCMPSCVGKPKVDALKRLVLDLTEVGISTRYERYRGQRLEGVVIAAVDNMGARQTIWQRVKLNPSVPLFIDPRMGAEFARIYSIRPTDPEGIALYEENLYSQTDAEPLPCSARAIVYCPTVVAGLIAATVKNQALGQPCKREILMDMGALTLVTTA
jgi:hypothetical protein